MANSRAACAREAAWDVGWGWPGARLPQAGEAMLPPYGVAAPDHPVVRLPPCADFSFHLLFDSGERGVANLSYSRGFVLDAEEHGILALDVLLLQSLRLCPALFL